MAVVGTFDLPKGVKIVEAPKRKRAAEDGENGARFFREKELLNSRTIVLEPSTSLPIALDVCCSFPELCFSLYTSNLSGGSHHSVSTSVKSRDVDSDGAPVNIWRHICEPSGRFAHER